MLIDLFLVFLASIVYSFSFFLPNGDTLSSDVLSSFSWLVSESYKFDYIFPIGTMWVIVSIMVPLLVSYFAWNGIQWLIGLIRGN
jgi:hypothetical protein